MKKVPHISFNYPLNYEYNYVFPTKYYLNVSTGHSIIKRDQINLIAPVAVKSDGTIEDIEEDEEEDKTL